MRLNLRSIGLRQATPSSAQLLDHVVQNALRGVCLNPFEPNLDRTHHRYLLYFDGVDFYDKDKTKLYHKSPSQPQPSPQFYYAEWFDNEEDAIGRRDYIHETFSYEMHVISIVNKFFLLELKF